MPTSNDFSALLAQDLGVQDSVWFQNFIATWSAMENTKAANNPLATTLQTANSSPLPGNPDGVQEYPTLEEGAQATAQTLKQSNFAPILQLLSDQNGPNGLQSGGRLPSYWGQFLASMREWGTSNFANDLETNAIYYSGSLPDASSAKPVSIVGSIGGAVGGAVSGAIASVSSVYRVFQWLLDPHHWFRLFFIALGSGMAIAGTYIYVRGPQAAKDVTNVGKAMSFE